MGSLPTSTPALGVGDAGTVTGGMVNACVGVAANSDVAVKMANRVITPSQVLLVPPSNDQSCAASETTLKLPSYANTVVVSASSAVSATNGSNLISALNGISATADHPYLLKLEPGVYFINNNSLTMKANVDIEGSGEGITEIVGIGSKVISNEFDSEVKNLSLSIDTEGTINAVVSINPDFKMTNVTLNVIGRCGALTVTGFSVLGTIKDSTITSTNFNGTVYGTAYGVFSSSGTVTVLNSVLQGGTNSTMMNAGAGKIANSQLVTAAFPGNLTCVGAYDASFMAVG